MGQVATTNRVVQEVGEVLARYGADSDATMEEWALAEFLWGALRLHHIKAAREKRIADSRQKS